MPDTYRSALTFKSNHLDQIAKVQIPGCSQGAGEGGSLTLLPPLTNLQKDPSLKLATYCMLRGRSTLLAQESGCSWFPSYSHLTRSFLHVSK